MSVARLPRWKNGPPRWNLPTHYPTSMTSSLEKCIASVESANLLHTLTKKKIIHEHDFLGDFFRDLAGKVT